MIPEKELVFVYRNHAESPDDMSKMTEEEYAKMPVAKMSQAAELFGMMWGARE